mmetsp:Transcript_16041/g.51177  ORF Transcript_16041/g.51177 Transcript_16041/m.51177 type:complete len:193 (+) Transcript_16041:282-860(+)
MPARIAPVWAPDGEQDATGSKAIFDNIATKRECLTRFHPRVTTPPSLIEDVMHSVRVTIALSPAIAAITVLCAGTMAAHQHFSFDNWASEATVCVGLAIFSTSVSFEVIVLKVYPVPLWQVAISTLSLLLGSAACFVFALGPAAQWSSFHTAVLSPSGIGIAVVPSVFALTCRAKVPLHFKLFNTLVTASCF